MTDFQSYMKENGATLSALMGRSSFPHFWIDCDFETTKPIRKCITNNTLGRILGLAVENKSVVMLHSQTLNKTPKMKEIDRIMKDQVQAVIQAVESTLEFKDKEEGVLSRGVYIRATEINELQAKINILQDLQKSYQTDELGLLYEKRLDDIQHSGPRMCLIQSTTQGSIRSTKWSCDVRTSSSMARMDKSHWRTGMALLSKRPCCLLPMVRRRTGMALLKRKHRTTAATTMSSYMRKKAAVSKPRLMTLLERLRIWKNSSSTGSTRAPAAKRSTLQDSVPCGRSQRTHGGHPTGIHRHLTPRPVC